MKKLFCLIHLCFFTFSVIIAQTKRNTLPGKPSEQKEIEADRHLEKEMQQKQLYSKPEFLIEPETRKEAVRKKNAGSPNRKSKGVRSGVKKC